MGIEDHLTFVLYKSFTQRYCSDACWISYHSVIWRWHSCRSDNCEWGFKKTVANNVLGKTLGLAGLLFGFLFFTYVNASKFWRQIKTFKNKEKAKLYSNLNSLWGIFMHHEGFALSAYIHFPCKLKVLMLESVLLSSLYTNGFSVVLAGSDMKEGCVMLVRNQMLKSIYLCIDWEIHIFMYRLGNLSPL